MHWLHHRWHMYDGGNSNNGDNNKTNNIINNNDYDNTIILIIFPVGLLSLGLVQDKLPKF